MLQMLTSICLIVLVTGLQAQQASYGAPSSSGYDASSAGYTAPEASYSAPGDSYAAGYNSYDYDGGYVATQEDGGLDLSKLTELLPLFVVVFAAIILAQLLSPLFLQLLGLLVGVLPLALSVKRPIIDAILAPFNLQLCDLTATGRSAPASFFESFGSLSSEVGWSQDQINIAANFADKAFEAISSKSPQ